MFIDLALGLVWAMIGRLYQLPVWQCAIIVLSALVISDSDIGVNEFYRFFIKKEKRFSLKNRSNWLDEYSYTHRIIFHQPLPIIVIYLSFGYLFSFSTFLNLEFLAFMGHLIHDTVDFNFDGITWLWPFNKLSFKIRFKGTALYQKTIVAKQLFGIKVWMVACFVFEAWTPENLKAKAELKEKNTRPADKIFKDNFICL